MIQLKIQKLTAKNRTPIINQASNRFVTTKTIFYLLLIMKNTVTENDPVENIFKITALKVSNLKYCSKVRFPSGRKNHQL